MANAVPKVQDRHFSGTSSVFSRTDPASLGGIVRGILRTQAKLAAAQIAPLIDHTGGVAGPVLAQISNVVPSSVSGNNCAAKADVDTAIGAADSGMTVLAAQIIAFQNKIPAFPAVANTIGGTVATPGTLPAVLDVFTPTNASVASAAGLNVWLAKFRANSNVLSYLVDELQSAVGLIEVSGSVSGTPIITAEAVVFPTAFVANPTNTGSAGTGTSDSVLATAAVTVFAGVAATLASFASAFNAMSSASTNLVVTAVASDR